MSRRIVPSVILAALSLACTVRPRLMDDCPHRADARLVAPVPVALALNTVAGGDPFAQGSTHRSQSGVQYKVSKFRYYLSEATVVTKGIATFMRSLVSGTSRYDRHLQGDGSALNAAEKRGARMALGERGECFHCHVGFNLTNNTFANNGMAGGDTGREKITRKADDRGKFKVPTLRNVALTAPYMHDGSLATLRDVVDHYSRGGQGHPNIDPTIRPLNLTEQEKQDLLAFLESLTDESFVKDARFAR